MGTVTPGAAAVQPATRDLAAAGGTDSTGVGRAVIASRFRAAMEVQGQAGQGRSLWGIGDQR
jgi:hypothetical protein